MKKYKDEYNNEPRVSVNTFQTMEEIQGKKYQEASSFNQFLQIKMRKL